MNIPFFRPSLDGNESKYVDEVLKSGWLTTAKKTAEFEQKFGELVGAEHAMAVNSCTAALHLALEALGVGPGDKVLVPSLTFTASAEVIRYLGADPVFLDIEYSTGLVTPEIVSVALEQVPQAKVCLIVHYGGQSACLHNEQGGGIVDLCEKAGVMTVIDAAHAFPASDNYGMVGSFGDVTCFSFYANKTITTGEGGMATTGDVSLAARIRMMRLHGIDRDVWDRFTSQSSRWEYDVAAPGFKYNLADLNSAVGLAQLERAEHFRDQRERCARQYRHHLSDLEHVDLLESRVLPEQHAWHLFPVVLQDTAPLSRNDLISRLADDGIGTSVHYKPLHRMSYYREAYDLREIDYPMTERFWAGCVSLPIYPSLSNEEIEFVAARLIHHVSGKS
jgi:dTDP-4-amino-4,6-dideoxygalactose transaminase